MSRFVLNITLKQETPIIHFQHNQEGATLRATEAKPKLDRFLVAQWDRERKDKVHEEEIPKAWRTGGDALDYKMHFLFEGEVLVSNMTDSEIQRMRLKDVSIPIDKSYFGNMVDKNVPRERAIREKYKETVLAEGPIQMKVFCRHPALLSYIEKHIVGFFLLHNFGTRQSKGFGSFKVVEINGRKESYEQVTEVVEKVKKYFPCKRLYYVDTGKYNYKQLLEFVRDIYTRMKSGINYKIYRRAYIYEYMHKKKIGNEKAWMKQKGISPETHEEKNEEQSEHISCTGTDFKYVRAMLGITDNIKYIEDVGDKRKKVNVSIQHVKKDIERLPSPILFKIVHSYIFILPEDPPEKIFDTEFLFEGGKGDSGQQYGNGILSTPREDDFKIHDFVKSFVKYYNDPRNHTRNSIPCKIKSY